MIDNRVLTGVGSFREENTFNLFKSFVGDAYGHETTRGNILNPNLEFTDQFVFRD